MMRFAGNAARSSLWLDTLPKVTRDCFPEVQLEDHRMDGFVRLSPGNSEIWIGGLDEKERVEKILGLEFSTIFLNEVSQISYSSYLVAMTRLAQVHPALQQRCYLDLNPVGTRHWTYKMFVQHIDPGSNKPLVDPDQYRYGVINPNDNRMYLSEAFISSQENAPERHRKRFYLGEYQPDLEGALWTFEAFEHARCISEDVPEVTRCVVGVDPSGTHGLDLDTRSDDIGIVVAAKGTDGNAYVLADRTCNLPPEGWAQVVRQAYYEFGAQHVIAESNFGGDMVRATIQSADKHIPVTVVRAPGQRGKVVRAEPISALYGGTGPDGWRGGRVKHVGEFRNLEDQLLNFTTAGYVGDRSPDAADALVWALTDLMIDQTPLLASPQTMWVVA